MKKLTTLELMEISGGGDRALAKLTGCFSGVALGVAELEVAAAFGLNKF